MWTSGVVLTLRDPTSLLEVSERLAGEAAIDVGEPTGLRLPVVFEAEDAAASRDRHEWFAALPNVLTVDLAFSSFDPPEKPGISTSTLNPQPSTNA